MLEESIDRLSFVVVGAGKSKRFLHHKKKIFYKINGQTPVFIFLLKNIKTVFKERVEIIFVHSREDKQEIEESLDYYNFSDVKLVEGGEERPASVLNGLLKSSNETVFIHDCARPFLSEQLLFLLYKKFKESKKPIAPYITPIDTVRIIEDGYVRTLDRDKVMLIQTPQVVKKSLYVPILKRNIENKIFLTDDLEYLIKEGIEVEFVEGDRNNVKITNPQDINIIETIYKGWINESRNRY
ncbi:MAG: 2-C-methyl-D-erythritol 4-phosphate cytidylyltransferase [candidate division WOR-3 bacterium]|jgi:2-C-methyl-D-erythritol 4-phosphate cytidylyltransferase